MKRPGGLPLHTAPQRRVGLRTALLPFLCALVCGSLFLRAARAPGAGEVTPRPVRQALEHSSSRSTEATEAPCLGLACGGPEGAAAAAATPGSDGGGGGLVPAAAGAAPAAAELPKLFLFIGILSGRGYRHRRLAVREAWANRAQIPGQVVAKFILSEDERTPQVEAELEQYGDIVFVREKTNYKSILYKTFYVLEYAATHYDAAYVLKTDDDAFINVAPMVEQLRLLCETPGCARERVYMGRMAKHSEVLLQPGHKWNNAAFYNHTGLKQYPNYMMGGGYVVGGEVARVLVDTHNRMRLKFTPIEDATLGFWLMSMDLRHIDHPRFYTWAAPCCFKPPQRKPGERFVTRFQLTDEFDGELCSPDPWLVLHKIDSPTKMRYVGGRVANCSLEQQQRRQREPDEPWVLPESIEEFVPEATRAQWDQERAAVLRERGLRPEDDPVRLERAKKAAAAKAAAEEGAEEGEEGGAKGAAAAGADKGGAAAAGAAGAAGGAAEAAAGGGNSLGADDAAAGGADAAAVAAATAAAAVGLLDGASAGSADSAAGGDAALQ